MFFNNTELELYSYNENSEVNVFGEPLEEYTLQETIKADIQPLSAEDNMVMFGKILQDTYKIYIDSDISIDDTMLLKIKDKPVSFKIKGSVMNYNHTSLNHQKVILEKQRKCLL